jgi:hypothetical protein
MEPKHKVGLPPILLQVAQMVCQFIVSSVWIDLDFQVMMLRGVLFYIQTTLRSEIKQRVLQYQLTQPIKKVHVPDQLKQAIKDIQNPQKARLSKPVVRFVEADTMPSDEDSASEDETIGDTEATLIESAQFNYPLPCMANSALAASKDPALKINRPFEYRALQE